MNKRAFWPEFWAALTRSTPAFGGHPMHTPNLTNGRRREFSSASHHDHVNVKRRTVCAADQSLSGFVCSQTQGHPGDHAALDVAGKPYATWTRQECGTVWYGTTVEELRCDLPLGHDGQHRGELHGKTMSIAAKWGEA